MNRINPIYAVLFLVLLVIIFMFGLQNVKSELSEAKYTYEETSQLAIELKGLKKTYSDKKAILKSIDRILRQSSLKSANIEKKITSSSFIITSRSIEKVAMNSLMSKFLNGAYNIHALKIKRLSAEKASIEMEIKW